jgi:hypothetical protein
MASQADLIGRKPQFSVIRGAMHVMTTEAGYSSPVHHALREIVPLHPVLMRRTFGEMGEA